MHRRSCVTPTTVVAAVLLAGSSTAAGQALAPAPAASIDLPRTPEGRPDLSGFWTNGTYTPLERPDELADKTFFTQEEATAWLQRGLDRLNGQPQDSIHYDDAIWQGERYEREPYLRTSIIVDPPNGRIPPLTVEGERIAATVTQFLRQREVAEGAEQRTLAERCISWGNVGPPMMPPTYAANLQIIQTADAVVMLHELMQEMHFVHLDGRPRLGDGVRQLGGDARGHWEGDTLVVETTNFTNQTNFRGSPQHTRQDIFASDTLRVTERLTMVDADAIRYQFTVEDPTVWTQPWSGEFPIRRIEGPIFEFACHEGNYGLANILSAIRASE